MFAHLNNYYALLQRKDLPARPATVNAVTGWHDAVHPRLAGGLALEVTFQLANADVL